jgi:two-component system, LytTR family, sensor histidine kinase AlgZ
MNRLVSKRNVGGFHLPDFCAGEMTLAVVLIVELVALILTTARQPFHNNFWIDLASTSLFLLWQGLISAAVLCRARPQLYQLTAQRAYALALALMVLSALIVAEMVYQLGNRVGLGFGALAEVFPASHAQFLLRTFAITFIVSSLALRYFHVSAEWRHSVELEAQARIRALQARIRPHFLFNSMNTIAALTRSDPERAEEAVEDLADLFRANLSEARSWIPLKEELEIARIYQRIEQLRLGERLKVKWDITDLPMRALVPSLLVQPLLENAVYHGIEPLPEGGSIVISGRFTGDAVELSVSNPVPADDTFLKRNGHGIALDNIQQRMELAWPGKASVELQQASGVYRVVLRFPFQERIE